MLKFHFLVHSISRESHFIRTTYSKVLENSFYLNKGPLIPIINFNLTRAFLTLQTKKRMFQKLCFYRTPSCIIILCLCSFFKWNPRDSRGKSRLMPHFNNTLLKRGKNSKNTLQSHKNYWFKAKRDLKRD